MNWVNPPGVDQEVRLVAARRPHAQDHAIVEGAIVAEIALAADPAFDALAAPCRDARADIEPGPRVAAARPPPAPAPDSSRARSADPRRARVRRTPTPPGNRGRENWRGQRHAWVSAELTSRRKWYARTTGANSRREIIEKATRKATLAEREASVMLALDKARPAPISREPCASLTLGAQVAQLVEHATENRSVGGSIPPLGTIQHFPTVSWRLKQPLKSIGVC